MHLRYCATMSAWAMVFLLAFAHPAFAQFTLDGFSPAHGATNVNTAVTVEFTFSAAVDTLASFNEDPAFDDFFLNLSLYPAPGNLLDTRVSGDGRTVAIDLQLEEDTKYQGVLEGAFDATGASLDRPYAFAFTTGDTLPRGSVSGTIIFDGGIRPGRSSKSFAP